MAIAFRVHLQDGRVMHKPVHGGHRHGLVRADLAPRRERHFDHDGDAFALLNQVKQHERLGPGAPGLAHIDQHDQVGAVEVDQVRRKPQGLHPL